MNIFLAASFSRGPELRPLRTRLQEQGHVVVSTWIDLEKKADPLNDRPMAASYALKDIADLNKAQLLVYFADEPARPLKPSAGGKSIEFGYAISLGIPIALIGTPISVYHFLPICKHFETFDTFLFDLAGAEIRAAKPAPLEDRPFLK